MIEIFVRNASVSAPANPPESLGILTGFLGGGGGVPLSAFVLLFVALQRCVALADVRAPRSRLAGRLGP